jgi:hypothetical protein
MQSDSDCFRFLFWGEKNSGFMPTEVQWTHGKKWTKAFLANFFPMGKTNALRGRISDF